MITYQVFLKSENKEWIPVFADPDETLTPINFLTHGFQVYAEKVTGQFARIRNSKDNKVFSRTEGDKENWVETKHIDWDTATGIRHFIDETKASAVHPAQSVMRG